ncbi:hypothetical protein AB4224_24015 [Vibrio lentus]
MNKFHLNSVKLINKAKEIFNKTSPMLRMDNLGAAGWVDDWVLMQNDRRTLMPFSCWVDEPQHPKFDLAKAFILEEMNRNHGHGRKRAQSMYAFRALELLNKPLPDIEQADLNNLTQAFDEKGYDRSGSSSFWGWCIEKKITPASLNMPKPIENRDRSPEEWQENRDKKLLADEQVAAIGVVYNELYSEEGLVKYGFKKYPIEYLSVAFCTLGISTPSRVNNEIFCLPNQMVKTHKDDDGNEVHSLFWKGSKNHPDNRTHLLDSMKDNVEHILEVLEPESLPAKILSCFMTNPSQSLNDMIIAYPEYNYKIEDYPKLDLKNQTNIFHLGLILGLYEEEPVVPVVGKGNVLIKVHSLRCWKNFKYLSEVKNYDLIGYDYAIMKTYLGIVKSWNLKSHLDKCKPYLYGDDETTTLFKMSNAVIDINKFNNGSLDKIVRGKDTSTMVSDAFFVFTNATLYGSTISHSKSKILLQGKNIPTPSIYNLMTSEKRPDFSKSWVEMALDMVGLKEMAFSPHKLRHWVNHHAKESGIPIEIINLWSGRKDADQAYEYIHTTDENAAQQVTSILVKKSEVEPSNEIKMISREQIIALRNLPATVMSEGVCTQDLVTMPCRFLNDFMTSCFGCSEMCYIKGDIGALSILKCDLDIQVARLSEVKSSNGFSEKKASQEWYKMHFNKTSVLKALIIKLEDEAIAHGSSVRIVGDLNSIEFRVQNLDTGRIIVDKQVLEDSNQSLSGLLDNRKPRAKLPNKRLANLLSKYGVNYGKS